MIVIDASGIVELVLRTDTGQRLEAMLDDSGLTLHAPQLFDLEVANALRRIARRGESMALRCDAALVRLLELDVERWPHEPLLARVWGLRHQLTAYDASYIVLAEALECDLLTGDARLSRAHGLSVNVRAI